jgi:hypothetical protein
MEQPLPTTMPVCLARDAYRVPMGMPMGGVISVVIQFH